MLIPFDYLFSRFNVKCTGILHAGASYVQERDMYDRLEIPEVIWVEAIPDVYEQAQLNLRGYHRQIILNACVSNETGKCVTFNVSNNEKQSSSYLPLAHHAIIHPEVHYTEQIEMVTIRLDELLADYETEHINFGNFDLQGTELDALIGLGEMIHQFDYFYLEVNKKEVYKGCALVDEIDEFLKDFQRVETSAFVADSWGDAFYVRKTLL